ncbi:MAG: ArnT family glycosyltransferase [Nanobdellota archaeon]
MILINIIYKALPFVFALNLILLIYCIKINWKYIIKSIKSVKTNSWVILGLITLSGFLLRVIMPMNHFMWIDEMLYVQAGKSILHGSFFQENVFSRPIGWPFILSIIFSVTGISNIVALKASFVLGVLTIPAVFLFVNTLIKNQKISLLASFIFAMFPKHIFWSNTAETNVASLFFITITLYFSTLYYKYKHKNLLWLSLISLSFIIHFRAENILFIFYFLIGVVLFNESLKKHIITQKLTYLFYLVFNIPNFIIIIHSYLNTPEAELIKNKTIMTGFSKYLVYLISDQFYSRYGIFLGVFILLLCIIGIYKLIPKMKKIKIYLVSFIIGFYLFNSVISPPNIDMGGISRFSLIFMPFIATLAAYGLFYSYTNLKRVINKKIIFYLLFVIFIFIMSSFYIYEMLGVNYKLDFSHRILATNIPQELAKENLENYTIITTHPETLAGVNVKKIIKIENFYANITIEKGEMLFYEGYFCNFVNEPVYGKFKGNKMTFDLCEWIKKKYNLSVFKKYKEKNITYTIYKFN